VQQAAQLVTPNGGFHGGFIGISWGFTGDLTMDLWGFHGNFMGIKNGISWDLASETYITNSDYHIYRAYIPI